MPPEPTKASPSSPDGDHPQKHKQLDREVRDMVNTITRRVGDVLHRPGTSHGHQQHHEVDEDEHGVRVITLAGNNTGATMRSELDEKRKSLEGISSGEPEDSGTYVNSNFQAVNNSIMYSSSYETNDPGVHLEISDFLGQHAAKAEKHEKKGKKKEKEMAKSEHQESD